MKVLNFNSLLKVSLISVFVFSGLANAASSKIESFQQVWKATFKEKHTARAEFEKFELFFIEKNLGSRNKKLTLAQGERFGLLHKMDEKDIIFDVPTIPSSQMDEIQQVDEAMFFHKLDLKSEEHMYVIASKFAEIFKQSPEKTREAYLQFIRKFADEGNSSPFTEISSTDFIAAFKSVDPGIESFYRIGSIVPENPLLGEVVLKGPSSMAEYLTTPLHKENIHHLIASSNYARVTRADSAMTRGLISGGLNKIHQGGSWALLNWARAHYIHIGPGNIESSNAVRELVRLINESTSFTIHNVNSEGDKVMADIFEAAKMDDSIFGEMLEYAIKIIDESKPIYKL